jgi:hypothetical protein
MTTNQNQARDYALALATSLEQRVAPGADEPFDVPEDVLEFIADTQNVLRLVLTLGGPRAELVLGDGAPRVEVWWGGNHHTCSTNINETLVEELIETWWRPTMEAALNG